ncbi:MAG TPA: phosphatase domain-containing protein [Thermoanaerobaculia bacterium]
MSWASRLLRAAHAVERPFDVAKRRLAWRRGGDRPVHVVPYRGYGNRERLLASGRVLLDAGIGTQGPSDPLWMNVVNTWRRFESDEVPGARVALEIGGRRVETVTDEEGYFSLELPPPPGAGPGWIELPVEIADLPPPLAGRPRQGGARLRVLLPPAEARFAVASDLDDTVVETGVTSKLVLARNVFLRNAHTRMPFPGVSAFYRALAGAAPEGFANPLFYVSASPWNLYDLIAGFLALQGLPEGPLLLRDLGLEPGRLVLKTSEETKLDQLGRLFATYPALPWILIGDSGERDPEIYAEVIRRHPGRVLAVYLREVTGPHPVRRRQVAALAEEVEAAGTPFLHVPDTVTAALHAAARGWIRAEDVDWVRQDRRLEEVRPTPAEAAAGGGEEG